MRLQTELLTAFRRECRAGVRGSLRKGEDRAFNGDLVVVTVAIFGVEKLIGRAPRKKRHCFNEPYKTRASD